MVAEPGPDVRIWSLTGGLTSLTTVHLAPEAAASCPAGTGYERPCAARRAEYVPNFRSTSPLAMTRLRPQWRPVDAVRVRAVVGDVVVAAH